MSSAPSQFHVLHYNISSILLHWLMFFLIMIAFTLALLLDVVPKEVKPFWVNVHFVTGTLVFALLWLRLIWRIVAGVPDLPETLHPHTRKASHLMHGLLYVLMGLVPLMGLLTAFYRGRGIDFGFYVFQSPFEADRATGRFFKEIHEFASWSLFLLAGGHAALALFHHYALKDGILLRMMPIKRR